MRSPSVKTRRSRAEKQKGEAAPAPQLAGTQTAALGLDDSIGFLLNESARLSRRLLHGRLTSQGLRGSTWFVLRVLWEGGHLTQRELADRVGLSQPSTLEMLRTLQNDQLVRLERDPHDKRKTRVLLTELAWSLKPTMLLVAENATHDLVCGLSSEEQAALRALLRTIRDTTTQALKGELGPTGQAPVLDEKIRKRGRPPAATPRSTIDAPDQRLTEA